MLDYVSDFDIFCWRSKNMLYFLENRAWNGAFEKPLLMLRRFFENSPVLPWHSKAHQYFLDIRKTTSTPLTLRVFSKTHQSSLSLKGGSTAFPKPLSPQGTGDVPTALLGAQTATLYGWRTIRGLRQQQSCRFLCGDEPALLSLLLARCWKATCSRLTACRVYCLLAACWVYCLQRGCWYPAERVALAALFL